MITWGALCMFFFCKQRRVGIADSRHWHSSQNKCVEVHILRGAQSCVGIVQIVWGVNNSPHASLRFITVIFRAIFRVQKYCALTQQGDAFSSLIFLSPEVKEQLF